MSDFKLANHYFSDGNYEKAKDLFLAVIANFNNDQEEVKSSFKKLILITNFSSNSEEKVNLLLLNADYEMHLSNFAEAEKLYDIILNIDPELTFVKNKVVFYLNRIHASSQSGNVTSLIQSELKFLDYCLSRKLIETGLKFLKERVQTGNFEHLFLVAEIKLLLVKNDIANIERKFDELFLILDSDKVAKKRSE